jgi:hypothetical protein
MSRSRFPGARWPDRIKRADGHTGRQLVDHFSISVMLCSSYDREGGDGIMVGDWQKATWYVFVVTVGALVGGAARAECTSPGFNPSGHFCNGCSYEGTMVISHDQACERPYRPNGNTPIEFLSNRVVQRARHGIAGANGTTFAYMPTKGYVGSDDFAVEVTYRQQGDAGKFRVHFRVTVQ